LYFYLLSSREVCVAAIKAIKAFNLPMYGLPGTLHEEICKELGVPFVPELFVDIELVAKTKNRTQERKKKKK